MIKKIIYILLLATIFTTIGCVKRGQGEYIRPKSTLEKRAIQTREYETDDVKMVMKAAMNVLQDEGFMLSNTELELGFITAKKHLNISSGSQVFSIMFAVHDTKRRSYNKTKVVEANIQVSKRGKKLVRMRVTFQELTLNTEGAITNVKHIKNASFYKTFFMKIDKGIFIEKEGV